MFELKDFYRNIPDEELFKNFERLWLSLGRQPVCRDIKKPFSKYGTSAYLTRFGTYRKFLEKFIEFVQPSGMDKNSIAEPIIIFRHMTARNPSERLKVRVLMRDGNKCRLCGLTLTAENIHFDHIVPWSKGGETVLENLQILCSKHNLAKGNVSSEDVEIKSDAQ